MTRSTRLLLFRSAAHKWTRRHVGVGALAVLVLSGGIWWGISGNGDAAQRSLGALQTDAQVPSRFTS